MATTTRNPGPIVCKAVGQLPLASVPGFPPKAAAALARRGVVTLLDLAQPVAEVSVTASAGGIAGELRESLAGLGLRGKGLGEAVGAVARHLRPDCMAAAGKDGAP